MPLILTQNDTNAKDQFDYEDDEGVQYQHPNMYKNIICPGSKFLYYRGSLDNARRRRVQEYFGAGLIDDVELDSPIDTPASQRLWMATINPCAKFDKPIQFKVGDRYLEPGANKRSGYFQQGVRKVEEDICHEMIGAASMISSLSLSRTEPSMPSLVPPLPGWLTEPPELINAPPRTPTFPVGTGRVGPRAPKWVGELGENMVCEWLKLQLWTEHLRWLERERIRSGWDIEYTTLRGDLIRVEVKSTVLPKMATCEIMVKEWKAAVVHGSAFHPYILTGVGRGRTPKAARIPEQSKGVKENSASLEPTNYRSALGATAWNA